MRTHQKKFPLFGIVALLFGGWLLFTSVSGLFDDLHPLAAPRGKLLVEHAVTEEEKYKGLSSRESLPENRGMLFFFDANSAGCFVMRDTLIPLDMIWLDKDKKVVNVKYNALPESYPQAFCPTGLATYVLEVNAGQAARYGIHDGVQLRW